MSLLTATASTRRAHDGRNALTLRDGARGPDRNRDGQIFSVLIRLHFEYLGRGTRPATSEGNRASEHTTQAPSIRPSSEVVATMDVTTNGVSGQRIASAGGPRVPIGDYGFLSDGETSALISPAGAVQWMCVPRFDSPSIFGAILGAHAGSFRLGPVDLQVPSGRRYLPGTMILETSWGSATGWLIVRDVLLVGPWRHDERRSVTHHRTPVDYDADHILLRTIRCVSGEVQTVLDCGPVFDYGYETSCWVYSSAGYNELSASGSNGPTLRLTTDMRLGIEGGQAVARTLLKEGDERFVALSWGDIEPPHDFDDAHQRLTWTAHHWQHWLARGTFPDHPWRSYLERSALTLKGLSYAPTGAIMAAATTSLPETIGGQRNYDYRYSWVRDSAFALKGMYELGFSWEAADFYHFLLEVASGEDDLRVMYGIGGEAPPDEREIDSLPGYADSQPVRIGNAAHTQHQHDVWGVLMDSVYLHKNAYLQVDELTWSILERQVTAALANWREPDAGIWEVRGQPQHFTSSKIMCWVAVDRGAKMAAENGKELEAKQWAHEADDIKCDILTHGVDQRGVLTQHYDTEDLDASALLAVLVGFLPPEDPRIRATVLTIADELTQDGLVLRYRTVDTDDGFTGQEGAFTICSFWLVTALSEIGEHGRAKALCAKLLSYAGRLELYAEEIDPVTGEQLGNFPQAFTHLALITAVLRVIANDSN
jgi:GH15 family glucan-1,4-alpha-glucosidase